MSHSKKYNLCVISEKYLPRVSTAIYDTNPGWSLRKVDGAAINTIRCFYNEAVSEVLENRIRKKDFAVKVGFGMCGLALLNIIATAVGANSSSWLSAGLVFGAVATGLSERSKVKNLPQEYGTFGDYRLIDDFPNLPGDGDVYARTEAKIVYFLQTHQRDRRLVL